MDATPTPQPSYAHGGCPEPLLGQTIGQNLRQTVERCGDREALVVRPTGTRLTYRRLWDETTRAARALLALGVKKGDRVGVWAPNRWEWVVVQFATARIGAILVNINPSYQQVELEYALRKSGCVALFLAKGFRKSQYEPMLAAVRPACPALRHVVVFDSGWDGFLELAGRADDARLAECEAACEFDDPINIQFTSGTTGSPKGATLTHHNILNNAYFVGRALLYTDRDRVCVPVPFYHCFGMVLGTLACASHGACMVVPAEGFDPLAVLETVQAEGCTSLYGVPTMFIAVLDHPRFAEFDLTTLRTGIMAGAPCPIERMRQVVDRLHMREVAIGYGMTEVSPIATFTAVDDPLEQRVGTVGRAHAHVEVKVADPSTGAAVPRGQPGEVCMRGHSVMSGYWDDEASTRAAIDPAGWMHSGDLGVLDADGYLRIVGRLKDMIIRGGENISPREIEEFLYTHPAVAEAQVVGVPSEKFGEEVMAFVRPRPGTSATAEELAEHCRGRIASFKVPKYWKFVESFPMTVTGKVQKFRLREQAVAELGLQQAAAVRTA